MVQMINPDLLQTFLVLAEEKHFTKAAEKLHMTQPGVSQHLKKLEEYFGVPLIQKTGKSFVLTLAGKNVVEYGERLFSEHKRLRESFQFDDPHAGPCRFASPGSYAFKVFDLLLDQAQKHPGLRVEVVVAPNASIVGYLQEERVDVGFMSEEPKSSAVEYSIHAKEKLLLALPKGKRVKSLESLRHLGYVNHPDGLHYAERLLSRNFPGEFTGMESFRVSVFINQINRILDPVVRGLGFAILPETACERYHKRHDLSLVSLPRTVEDPIYRVVRRGDRLAARYRACLELLSR